jgi:heme exporter protein D
MMPDLGKYAVSVLTAYGASLLLLVGIVWISLRRGMRVRDALRAIEARLREGQGGGDADAERPTDHAAPAGMTASKKAGSHG